MRATTFKTLTGIKIHDVEIFRKRLNRGYLTADPSLRLSLVCNQVSV